MKRIVTIAACIAALIAAPSFAQETTAPEETAPAPGGDLALGESTEPQVGQIYQREEHGDWIVRCVRAPEGQNDPCQLFQRLSDAEGNPTADVNFFNVAGNEQIVGGATIITPLETLLTAQVTLSVDGGAERRYPFAFCDAQGCYARLGFTEAEMAQFRAGVKATIIIRPALAPQRTVVMEASLRGFTAGIQAVTAANAAQ